MTPRRVLLDTLFLILVVAVLLFLAIVVASLKDPANADVYRTLEPANMPVPYGAAWAPRPGFALRTVPPPPAAPRAAYQGGGGCSSGPVHDLIVAEFGAEASNALTVATRESHCTSVVNGDSWPTGSGCHASGVFQILVDYGGGNGQPCDNWSSWSASCGFAGASVMDWVANVKVSACIQARYGWGSGTWPL